MIGRLNHVAIAVRDIAKAANVYRQTLGAQVSEPMPQPEHEEPWAPFVNGTSGRTARERGAGAAILGGRKPVFGTAGAGEGAGAGAGPSGCTAPARRYTASARIAP